MLGAKKIRSLLKKFTRKPTETTTPDMSLSDAQKLLGHTLKTFLDQLEDTASNPTPNYSVKTSNVPPLNTFATGTAAPGSLIFPSPSFSGYSYVTTEDTPLKKTFILTQFGTPHPWTQEFIDHVQHLEKKGWSWIIFTPNEFESKGNVTIVPMTCFGFNELVEKKLGVRPNLFTTPSGIPSVHVTDFYVASGIIFEDYLSGADFWGITNIDVVYGDLNDFYPDRMIGDYDIITDEPDSLNGVFALFRNEEHINELFKQIPDWEKAFTQDPCVACVTGQGKHTLYGTDEYGMSKVIKSIQETPKPKEEEAIRVWQPLHYPWHGHDRTEIHVPNIKLSLKEDGSLWELIADTAPPPWEHARPFIGREIPFFHFMKTKTWPKL